MPPLDAGDLPALSDAQSWPRRGTYRIAATQGAFVVSGAPLSCQTVSAPPPPAAATALHVTTPSWAALPRASPTRRRSSRQSRAISGTVSAQVSGARNLSRTAFRTRSKSTVPSPGPPHGDERVPSSATLASGGSRPRRLRELREQAERRDQRLDSSSPSPAAPASNVRERTMMPKTDCQTIAFEDRVLNSAAALAVHAATPRARGARMFASLSSAGFASARTSVIRAATQPSANQAAGSLSRIRW